MLSFTDAAGMPRNGSRPQDAGLIDHLLLATWTEAARRVAVEADESTLTYGALRDRALGLAHLLTGHGVTAEQRVAVLLDRSAELVVALTATLFAGGAHLAIDPDDPVERSRYMLADSAPAVLITSAAHLDRLGVVDCPVLLVEELGSPVAAAPPPLRHHPDSPAYAIYTSGSTGRPKASLIPHRALASRLAWLQRTYRLRPEDRVLYKTACGFDVSVAELYWPLVTGAQLVVATPGGQRDPDYLAEAVLERGVTTLHFVPSLLELFLNGRPPEETYPGLRMLLAGGEALAPELVRRFHARTPAALHNLYGPSECAIYSTAWECPRDPEPEQVLIGPAVDDTELWVLDEAGQPVPTGEVGELFIGGPGLARGYLGRPGLTAERFVPHHLGAPGARLYRSGDLVRAQPDGALEFLGRADSQLKIRGNRVEPGEVENELLAVPGVVQAAVVPRQQHGRTELAAFLVTGGADPPGVEAVREALRNRLPGYMVPAVLLTVDDLPLTPNGKLDRALLRERALAVPVEPAAEAGDPPRGPLEEAVARVWAEVLSRPAIGRDEDFFDLGGDSLTAVHVTRKLTQHLGVKLPMRLLFREPTLAGFAELVRQATDSGHREAGS